MFGKSDPFEKLYQVGSIDQVGSISLKKFFINIQVGILWHHVIVLQVILLQIIQLKN